MAKGFMSYEEKVDAPREERRPDVEVVSTGRRDIDIDDKMQQVLGGGEGMKISAPVYTTLKRGHLQISYAIINEEDYYYQVELLKIPDMNDDMILAALIQAFSTVVPNHIHTYIKQPPDDIDWKVYTVIVKGGARLMGAKAFMEKKLVDKLLDLEFWN